MALTQAGQPRPGNAKKVAVALVLMVVAAVVLYLGMRGSQATAAARSHVRLMYVVDPKSHELSAMPARNLISTPGVVCAHVFSVGGCGDPESRWVGFLERLTPEAFEAMNGHPGPGGPNPDSIRAVAEGRQVSDPNTPDQWVGDGSDQGRALKKAAMEPRDGNRVVECSP